MSINEKILAAATELFELHNKRPTIAQVRDFIGSGSYSTITKAMQTWQPTATKEQKNEVEEVETKEESKEVLDLNAVPEALQKSVMSAVEQVWITAKTDAEQRIAQINSAAHAQVEAITAEHTKAITAVKESATAATEQYELQLNELSDALDTAEAKKEAAGDVITSLDKALDVANNKISELESKIIKQEATATAESKAASTTIKNLEELLDKKDKAMQATLDAKSAAEAKAESSNKSLTAAEQQVAAISKKLDAAHQKTSDAVAASAKAAGRIEELEKQIKALQQASKDNTKK